MRAIAYIRVSTEEQAIAGASVEAQRAALRRYADANDITIIAEQADLGVSSSVRFESRPGGHAAIAALVTKDQALRADALLVIAVDRLFRDVREGLEFFDWAKTRKIVVLSLREALDSRTASGRMMLTVALATGEYERNIISERTKAALAQRAREGRVTGAIPFGCVSRDVRDAQGRVVVRYLERDPATWAIREHVVALYRNGLPNGKRVGFGKLSLHLVFEEKLPAPGGGAWWSKATLKSMHDTHDRLAQLPFAEAATTATA